MSSNGHESSDDRAVNSDLTTAAGSPVVDNNNILTAGARGPMLLQDVWESHDVETLTSRERLFRHPEVGDLHVEQHSLAPSDHPNLRLVTFIPMPSTDTLQRLRRLLDDLASRRRHPPTGACPTQAVLHPDSPARAGDQHRFRVEPLVRDVREEMGKFGHDAAAPIEDVVPIHPPSKEKLTSTYSVGYIVGSLSSTSINRILANALIRLAPDDLSFVEIPIGNLPLYSQDYDTDYPPAGRALKEAIAAADAILFVTPEYNRSIPGALKNAIDWASRPWGQNSFDHVPAAVIGASPGSIGTAVGQQSLRAVLSYANARQLTAPEAYITFKPEIYGDDGSVSDDSTAQFLRKYMQEFRDHIQRVLTVLPRHTDPHAKS